MAKKSEEWWDSTARDYLQRSCTQEEFCRRRGVKASTLQYHVSRIRKSGSQEIFLPLEIGKDERKEVTLEFPSGLRVSIRG
ncbi:MAG: hypothetical protein KDD69_16115 [Bdellovibrionales bacterium]|nr:hypothetical protein [Bdellovibrionales bacterium]